MNEMRSSETVSTALDRGSAFIDTRAFDTETWLQTIRESTVIFIGDPSIIEYASILTSSPIRLSFHEMNVVSDVKSLLVDTNQHLILLTVLSLTVLLIDIVSDRFEVDVLSYAPLRWSCRFVAAYLHFHPSCPDLRILRSRAYALLS